jgi:hypothetical protein
LKNELQIIETQCDLVADTLYIVRDAHRVYMKTMNKGVAEATFDKLKAEYRRDKNAS